MTKSENADQNHEAKGFNWPEIKWFSKDNKAALSTLVSIIKESTAYKNPQTTGDGFLVEAVLWLERNNLSAELKD